MSKIRDFLLDELKTVLWVTGYFLSWFVVIGVLKSLTLADYGISYRAVGGALFGSLVIAKVVVILDKTKAGERFSERRALQHILYRSATYGLAVTLTLFAEKIVEAMLDGATLGSALEGVWDHRDRNHVLTTSILLALSFVFYNTLSVVNRSLDGGLKGLLMSPLGPDAR